MKTTNRAEVILFHVYNEFDKFGDVYDPERNPTASEAQRVAGDKVREAAFNGGVLRRGHIGRIVRDVALFFRSNKLKLKSEWAAFMAAERAKRLKKKRQEAERKRRKK